MTNLIESEIEYARKTRYKKGVGPRACLMYCLLAIAMFGTLNGQTPTDALMMPAREACVLLGYDQGTFDRYWEGSRLRGNETIATVDQSTILPMAAIGIIDDLNFYLSMPYVQTESSTPNGGYFTGARGFQDLGVALKYRAIRDSIGSGVIEAFGTTGFSTPIANYLSDYRPYSIGFGAPEFSLRAISQYQWNNGLYLRGSLAHLWRGYTKAERDYYYNNGSYYSAWMDVPNAWSYEGVAGKWFFNYALKVELAYTGLVSTSGDDIRAYNAAQPTNKTKFNRIGLSAQYYIKGIKGLGIVAYHNRIVDGRNVPKINSTGFGLTYQFNYINSRNDEANTQ